MKELSILRHGKAVPAYTYAVDFDRPLAKRGRKDTKYVARMLTTYAAPVERVICSPSLRTTQTLEVALDQFPTEPELSQPDEAYLASADTLLSILRQAPSSEDHILVIGHNPGLEYLVSGLCTGATDGLNIQLPTCGLVYLHVEIHRWDQLRWGAGVLRLLVAPKALRKQKS